MATSKVRSSKTRQRALKAGYRSGLEEKTAEDLTKRGISYTYEKTKIKYRVEEDRTYTPDFVLLSNGIVVETKGRFTAADRKKHLLIQKQHPDIDIRFVFSNANNKLNKGSKTSYAAWCDKHGFMWADKHIPEEWLNEPAK